MNKKEMSVWYMPMPKRYYLTHPKEFFRGVKRSFVFAHQRRTKGYCDGDWWSMDEWFRCVVPMMLRDMAEKGMAYPGKEPFETEEKWHDWLYKMADNLEKSAEDYEVKNEYEEQWHRICQAKKEYGEEFVDERWTAQEKIIRNKYLNRVQEIHEEKHKLFKDTMAELVEHWECLWD